MLVRLTLTYSLTLAQVKPDQHYDYDVTKDQQNPFLNVTRLKLGILYSDFLGYMTLSKLDFLFLENITGLRAVDIFLASIYAPCLGKLSQYLKSWVIVHFKKKTKISHKSGHF